MKHALIFCFLLLFSFFVQAQNRQQISVDLNRSFNGSGDLGGVGFAVQYGWYAGKHLEIAAGISATVHHDEYSIFVERFGSLHDVSYRTATGGLQLNGLISFAPLHTLKHEFRLGAGPVLRYQSSGADSYAVYYPPSTNFPEPVFSFSNYEKQNIISAGYQVAAGYAFTLPRQFLIGAQASFQNDTNGDVITQYGLRIGKRF